jgi:hypothetical protein
MKRYGECGEWDMKDVVHNICMKKMCEIEKVLQRGGLVLALNQVLRKHWLGLTTFLDFDRLVEDGEPRWS